MTTGQNRPSPLIHALAALPFLALVPLQWSAPTLTPVAVALLSLLAYRAFARATGLFRWRLVSAVVAAAILAVMWASLAGFTHHLPIVTAATATVIITTGALQREHRGYIQRSALGISAFLLFGLGLGRIDQLGPSTPLLAALIGSAFLSHALLLIRSGEPTEADPAPRISAPALALSLAAALPAFFAYRWAIGQAGDSDPRHAALLALLTTLAAPAGTLVLRAVARDLGLSTARPSVADAAAPLMLSAPALFHALTLITPAPAVITP